MELKVGGSFRCPEGHKAKIIWISEDKRVVAVRCPCEHLKKVVKVYLNDHTRTVRSYRNRPRKEREIYVKNMVFLIKIQ